MLPGKKNQTNVSLLKNSHVIGKKNNNKDTDVLSQDTDLLVVHSSGRSGNCTILIQVQMYP